MLTILLKVHNQLQITSILKINISKIGLLLSLLGLYNHICNVTVEKLHTTSLQCCSPLFSIYKREKTRWKFHNILICNLL